jgi:hypothetical protein
MFTPVGSITVHIYTQRVHWLTSLAAVHYTFSHKHFTGLYPVAAVQYTYTNIYYTGWHPVAAIHLTFTYKEYTG